jgi:hypothetical protein
MDWRQRNEVERGRILAPQNAPQLVPSTVVVSLLLPRSPLVRPPPTVGNRPVRVPKSDSHPCVIIGASQSKSGPIGPRCSIGGSWQWPNRPWHSIDDIQVSCGGDNKAVVSERRSGNRSSMCPYKRPYNSGTIRIRLLPSPSVMAALTCGKRPVGHRPAPSFPASFRFPKP